MVLKIFIKIGKDNQPVIEGEVNKYYDSDEITLSPIKDAKVKFSLFVKGVDDYMPVTGEIDLDTHGYELLTPEAKIIERYITKVNL